MTYMTFWMGACVEFGVVHFESLLSIAKALFFVFGTGML